MCAQQWRRVERIGSLLADVLPARVRRNMAGWKALELWPQVAGEKVARRTAAVAFRDGRLTVEVVNSAWIQRLSSSNRHYLKQLNQAVGSAQVTDIVYRVNPSLTSMPASSTATPAGETQEDGNRPTGPDDAS